MSLQDIRFNTNETDEVRTRKLRSLVEEISRLANMRRETKTIVQSGDGTVDPTTLSAITVIDETLVAPSSRRLVAGDGVSISISNPGQLVLSSTVNTSVFRGTADPVPWGDLSGVPLTFPPSAHAHAIADVTGLQAALDSKLDASLYTASDVLAKLLTVDGAASGLDADLLDGQHGSYYLNAGNLNAGTLNDARVAASNVTQHQAALSINWSQLTSVPSTFPPSAHTHLWAEITDKPSTFPPSAHTHVAADVTDFPEAVDDRVAALLVAGSNISLTYNDAANTLTIDNTWSSDYLTFVAQSASPGANTLWMDDGSNYESGTMVWPNQSVFLGEMSIGAPGTEQGSIQVNGSAYDAILKINEFGETRDAALILHRHATSTAATLAFARARGTDATHVNVQDGDVIGFMDFVGWHTSSYHRAAEITVEVDGSPGAADMPGRIVFKVSPDGSQTPEQALSITSSKEVRLGTDGFMSFDEHASAPGTPPSGRVALYAKSDGRLYLKDDVGTEINLTAAPTWGSITGTLSAQTDLQSSLDAKLNASAYTASDVLSKLLTVDGSGSGLDADLLDGQSGAYYLDAANITGDVAFSQIAQIDSSRILGRVSAGTGDIEALTVTQVTALLDVFTTSLKGLVPASGGGTTNFLRADGTWAAPTGTGTDLSYTASTRLLASSTGADVTLPLVSSTNAGLAPASGGGTTNFLRADGTWAAPPSGGSVSWGSITGTLSNQTDLQSALNAKLDASAYTASDVLTKLLTVDGAGSGIDADLLDGQSGAYYLAWSNLTGVPSTFTPSAHTHSAADITSGTLSDARLSTNVSLLSGTQTFTGTKTFSARPTFSSSGALFTPSTISSSGEPDGDLVALPASSGVVRTIVSSTGSTDVPYQFGVALQVDRAASGSSSANGSFRLFSGGSVPEPYFGVWDNAAAKWNYTAFSMAGHTHLWADITDKPSTFTPSVHTHSASDITSGWIAKQHVRGIEVADTRSVNTAPAGLIQKAVQFDFKERAVVGAPGSLFYVGVMSFSPWNDASGGPNYQLAFSNTSTEPLLALRSGNSGGSWNSWREVSFVGHTHLWADITDKPSTFTPSAHTHAASDITSGTLSDARLSSNVPLKNAINTFTQPQQISNVIPWLGLHESDQAVDERWWLFLATSKTASIRAYDDAIANGSVAWQATRGTGTAITGIVYGNSTDNPSHSFFGRQEITQGAEALRLLAGSASDHVYMTFHADSAAQGTRSAYIGYPSAGSTSLTVRNEFSGGIIDFSTNNGAVTSNGDFLVQRGATYTDPSSGLDGIGIRNTGSSASFNAFGIVTGAGNVLQVRNNGDMLLLNRFRADGAGAGNGGSIEAYSSSPMFAWFETDAPVDGRRWYAAAVGGQLRFRAIQDAVDSGSDWLMVSRSGTTPTTINFPNGTVQVAGTSVRDAAILTSGTLSDARLSSNVPLKNAINTFTQPQKISGPAPWIGLDESDRAADERWWLFVATGKAASIRAYDDSLSQNRIAWSATRGTGYAISSIVYGNTTDNPTHFFYGVVSATNGINVGSFDTTLDRLSAGKLGVEGRALLAHGGSYTSGNITFSTSAPSGGSDGDIWFQYT